MTNDELKKQIDAAIEVLDRELQSNHWEISNDFLFLATPKLIRAALEAVRAQIPDEGLASCPFCSSKIKIGSLGGDQENWAVWCDDCGGTCFETSLDLPEKQHMIDRCNTRAIIEDMKKRLGD